MNKFTFILNFRGGIYISQVDAVDVKSAMHKWAKELDYKEIKHVGEATKRELISEIEEEEPMLLTGMNNVWCISFCLKVGFFLGNIVKS